MRRIAHHPGLALAILTVSGLFAWLPSTAAAEFGPIQLVSKSAKEQASFGREPALSANGDYVAFYGELGGRIGIFRKDLASGALTLVVEGVARAPSISADGRYVSFTTTQSLEPVADPTPGSEDVYVADLASSPTSYELASSSAGQRMSGSSFAAPRVALSADGSEVAFVDEGEVYVRRLAEAKPILITAKREPVGGTMTAEPVPGGGAYQPAGAALSADGNAVAWVGEHLREQVPLLHDEEEAIAVIEARSEAYREPLWREVPGGASPPPTRRFVGGGDPTAPGCPLDGGELSETACQGPFPRLSEDHHWEAVEGRAGKGWGVSLPKLSADGDTVAVIGSPEEIEDLFVVDMSAVLSRSEAVRQLTRWTNTVPPSVRQEEAFEKAEYQVYSAPIRECAISPDGERIAFTTQRQAFPLSPPTLITAKPATLPTVAELYQINLEGQTIERITPGPGTGVSLLASGTETVLGETTFGAAAPSYSADDRTLAFASGGFNLVTGDANESSDVFTVETKAPAATQPSTISAPPSSISVYQAWRLTAHAVSRPDGAVRIVAGVPGTGTLSAGATSQVGSRASSRKVSTAHRGSPAAGVVRLELSLPRRLRDLAGRKGGLFTSLDIRFSGPGGKTLTQRLSARFRVHHGSASKAKKGSAR